MSNPPPKDCDRVPAVGPLGLVADDFTPEMHELGDTGGVFAWQDRSQPPEFHERAHRLEVTVPSCAV